MMGEILRELQLMAVEASVVILRDGRGYAPFTVKNETQVFCGFLFHSYRPFNFCIKLLL
jgi:hypothetical protein